MLFAIYKGDELLLIADTINECAEFLGVKEQTAKFISYAAHHRELVLTQQKFLSMRCRNVNRRIKVFSNSFSLRNHICNIDDYFHHWFFGISSD